MEDENGPIPVHDVGPPCLGKVEVASSISLSMDKFHYDIAPPLPPDGSTFEGRPSNTVENSRKTNWCDCTLSPSVRRKDRTGVASAAEDEFDKLEIRRKGARTATRNRRKDRRITTWSAFGNPLASARCSNRSMRGAKQVNRLNRQRGYRSCRWVRRLNRCLTRTLVERMSWIAPLLRVRGESLPRSFRSTPIGYHSSRRTRLRIRWK